MGARLLAGFLDSLEAGFLGCFLTDLSLTLSVLLPVAVFGGLVGLLVPGIGSTLVVVGCCAGTVEGVDTGVGIGGGNNVKTYCTGTV